MVNSRMPTKKERASKMKVDLAKVKSLPSGFTKALTRQTGPAPESKLAAALLMGAANDGRGRLVGEKTGLPNHDVASARNFLTTDSVMLTYWCGVAGLDVGFVQKAAKLEFEVYDAWVEARKPKKKES